MLQVHKVGRLMNQFWAVESPPQPELWAFMRPGIPCWAQRGARNYFIGLIAHHYSGQEATCSWKTKLLHKTSAFLTLIVGKIYFKAKKIRETIPWIIPIIIYKKRGEFWASVLISKISLFFPFYLAIILLG